MKNDKPMQYKVFMPRSMARRLEYLAFQRETTRSAIIREALAAYLQRNSDETSQERHSDNIVTTS